MICKNCGAELEDNAKFCGNCGARVEPAEKNEYIPPVMPQEENRPPFEPSVNFEEKPETAECEYVPHVDAEKVNSVPYSEPAQTNNYAGFSAQPTEEINTTLWIILAAAEVILCCGSIPGIVSLIFAIIAAVKKNDGDVDSAAKNVKIAKIAFFVGLALAVIVTLLYIILIAAGVISEIG